MKHFLIAALAASTFLSPAAHAANGMTPTASNDSTANSVEFRRGEGRRGAESVLGGGGEQNQNRGQNEGRGQWRGERSGGNDGQRWQQRGDRGGDRGNRGGWQQPDAQPQPQAQPQRQPQPRRERWRGQADSNGGQPQTDWRGGREGRGGRDNDWRRDDRRSVEQPQVQTQPQPQPQNDWRNRQGGDDNRWENRRDDNRDERGAGEWLRRHQDGNDNDRRRDNDRRDNDGRDNRYDNGWDRDRGGWSRDDDRRHDDRYGNGWDRDRGNWDRDNRRDDRRDDRWRHDRRDNDRWDNNWRNDRRYDWRGHRDRYRDHYRRPNHYYAPYRNHRYSRFSIGLYIGTSWYSDNYWINDPWYYRLPPVHGPYRWVRYYDDVLLIDTRNGYVVDVIYDFFW